MTDNLREFADWMGTPEGQARLSQFWDDAQQTASDMLRLVGKAIELADKVAALTGNRFGLTNGKSGQVDAAGNPVASDGETGVIGRTWFFPGVKEDSWFGRLLGGGDHEGENSEGVSGGGWTGPEGGTPLSSAGLQSDLQNQLNTGNVQGGGFLGALGDPEVWGEKWTSFSDTVSTGWNEKVWPSLQGVKDKAFEIGEGFVSDVQTKAGNAWTGLKTNVSDGWDSMRGTWDTLKTEGLGGLANEFTSKITNGAVTSWTDLPSHVASGVGDIINTHFPGLSNGLSTLQGWFQTGVEAIGRLWDGLREKLRGPINFVIREVYNNGIAKFWNMVGPKIGLGTLDPITEIPAFNKGGTVDGVMSGYSPGVDDRIIAVGGGEAVIRPEWTRAVGSDYVDAANSAARNGGVNGVRQFLGAYASGGTVMPGAQITSGIQQSMWDRIREQFPDIYLTSATRYQDVGSGFDFHMGEQAIDVDGPNKQGYADWIAEAFPNALELFWDPGPNIDNGSPTGAIGGHSDHVHWAMDAPVGDVDPSFLDRVWGGVKKVGSAISSKFRNMAADLFEKPLNALGGMIPDQFEGIGEFGQIPKKFYNTVKDKLVNFVRGKASDKDGAESKGGNTPYDISAGAEQWRDTVLKALDMTGHDASEADIVLKQIQIESGGDPNAINDWDINAQNGTPSKGLIQTIDPTFQAYRDPSLPDSPYDPLANLVAGIRYADATYGDIKNIWPKTMGYDAGGILPDDAMALNTSGKPEAVFTHDEWKMLERFAELIGRPDFIDQLAAITGGPAEMPKDPSIMANGVTDPGPGNYGTGAGTVAAGGYVVPGEGVTAGLQAFDKLHGAPGSAGAGGGVDHLANAKNVVTQSLSSYGQKLPGIAKTFLGGWIPEELLNPGGLVGGLLSAGEELFNWYRNQATGGGAGAASPLGGFDPGSVISGFLGGGTTPAPAYQAAPLPTVDQFVKNAPAPAATAGVGSAGDIYNFHVTNIDEAFRKFQQVQARKAAGFMPR
ncbi:transglycosylase SLT domain-containing protein [Rhodococcus rhodochrous]|uniref:lytic transglycosylase domain-containing protein n=1 Tax=Rhodococcus rhodochrous TaxID=1829 RepID=UPI0012FDCD9E|nr:transglycosylase SLT domain-containing protein [Rhodococcus rhodochrous]